VKGTRECAQLRLKDSKLDDLREALASPHVRGPIAGELRALL
jgi:hypothetical protein